MFVSRRPCNGRKYLTILMGSGFCVQTMASKTTAQLRAIRIASICGSVERHFTANQNRTMKLWGDATVTKLGAQMNVSTVYMDRASLWPCCHPGHRGASPPSRNSSLHLWGQFFPLISDQPISNLLLPSPQWVPKLQFFFSVHICHVTDYPGGDSFSQIT